MRRRYLWGFATLAVMAWLLWMTLRPQAEVASELNYITTPAQARGLSPRLVIGLLGNIIVFVPLGAAAAAALGDSYPRARMVKAILVGACLSATIELLQLAIPSRVSAWDDWLLNTLGTAVGALITLRLHTRIGRHLTEIRKP